MNCQSSFPVPRLSVLAALVAGAWASLVAGASAQQIVDISMHAKAVLHQDGTRTDSVKDVTGRQLTETTYDSRNVVIARKTFLLNENGDPLQGLIHDGAGNLIARVEFFFDSLGRLIEERCVNTRSEVFRRVIRQYDVAGKSLPPKAFDYAVNAPNMKPATLNFTTVVPPPDAANTTTVGAGQANGRPQIMSVSPTGRATVRPEAAKPAEEKKKRGWFGLGKK
ncbi:MAG: hypothetical protein ACAI34_09785 [Verrucomicrobium sp.]